MGTRLRYPGVNYFTSGDADIFKGREEDTKRLLTRLMLNNTLVLHGESGKGKSSLVQAGLLAEIERHNKVLKKNGRLQYCTVTIRMDEVSSKNTAATEVLQFVTEKVKQALPAQYKRVAFFKQPPQQLMVFIKAGRNGRHCPCNNFRPV